MPYLYYNAENGQVIAISELPKTDLPANIDSLEIADRQSLPTNDIGCLKVKLDTKEVIMDEDRFNLIKQVRLQHLQETVTEYIFRHYPDVKQRSDISDLMYWSNWLVTYCIDNTTNERAFSIDRIETMSLEYAKLIYSKQKTLSDVIADIKENLLPNIAPTDTYTDENFESDFIRAWEQIIKAKVRHLFVQDVKAKYNEIAQAIEKATKPEDIPHVDETMFPDFPSF